MSTPACSGAPLPVERGGGETRSSSPSAGKMEAPVPSEDSSRGKPPPDQAPTGAEASVREANLTGSPFGAGSQGASPKGAPPLTASGSLTDRLACKEENFFPPPPVQPILPPAQPVPAPAPAPAAVPSPAAGAAPNRGRSMPPSPPDRAKIVGPYPSTSRENMGPSLFAPGSRRSFGRGSGPFQDANHALGLNARPRQAPAPPSPLQAAPGHAGPVHAAAPSPGQCVTLTLPRTWGPGKQLRLRFGDGACTPAAYSATVPLHHAARLHPPPDTSHCVHYLFSLPPRYSRFPRSSVHSSRPPHPHANPHHLSALPGRCVIVTPPMGLKARRLADRSSLPPPPPHGHACHPPPRPSLYPSLYLAEGLT